MAERVFIASTGLFAGASLAVSLVAMPGVIASTKRRESWQRVYDTGKYVVVPLLLTTVISGGLLYSKTPNPKILAATVIGGFPMAFTAIAMSSNIKALESIGNNDPKVDGLVNTWANLHAVRTAAGLAAFESIRYDRHASSHNGETTDQDNDRKELSGVNYDTRTHRRQRPRDFAKRSTSIKGSDIPDKEEKQFFKELLDTLLDGTSPPKSMMASDENHNATGTKEFSKIEQQLRNMALKTPTRLSPTRSSSAKDAPKAPRLFDEVAGATASSLWEDSSPTMDLGAKDKELKRSSAITELKSSVELTQYVLDQLLNPDKEIDENYPGLLAASIKHASLKLNDPYLALSIFQQAKSRGVESYIAGCTTSVYNSILNLRWEKWKDVEGMDSLIQEMVANGVSFNDGTRRIVRDAIEEIEKDYSGDGISGDGIRWSSEQHQASARMRSIVSKWLVK